ncbi:MAG: FprA family A-type flavoprotein [Heliobacteriaceae bacterium]|jgi:flavorubredoxin|nr:FprA family A-type flavoprotein [Heliobacteriaceae bacterium]
MKEIKNNVYYCGITDSGRKYFDELIPLEHGTGYNSYFIKGSRKNALIDTTYTPKTEKFIENLGGVRIDYIIANHGEQDHTGAIPALLEKYPSALVLTNPKCKANIMEMLSVPEDRIRIVADGEEVLLGDKTLKFIYAPGVHWPDTMFTYLQEDNLLFTCDFLGAHQAFNAKLDLESAKRYYAEIMMPFAPMCRKYIKLVREIAPSVILPSHGPMYTNPEIILNAYEDWTAAEGKNLVLMPYISMYGSTKEMVDYTAEKLEKNGVKTLIYDVLNGDLGEFAVGLVDATTIILASPMVLAGPHPIIIGPAYLLSVLRPKMKFLSFIGSYGWGGDLFTRLGAFLSNLHYCEPCEPVLAKGKPKPQDFAKLDDLVNAISEKHRELGLV